MSFEPEEKALEDAELEMVIQVIRRGLKEGARIENLEVRLGSAAAAIKEAAKRLKELNRIAQEVCQKFERAIDPGTKQDMTILECAERMKWIQEKRDQLNQQLN